MLSLVNSGCIKGVVTAFSALFIWLKFLQKEKFLLQKLSLFFKKKKKGRKEKKEIKKRKSGPFRLPMVVSFSDNIQPFKNPPLLCQEPADMWLQMKSLPLMHPLKTQAATKSAHSEVTISAHQVACVHGRCCLSSAIWAPKGPKKPAEDIPCGRVHNLFQSICALVLKFTTPGKPLSTLPEISFSVAPHISKHHDT